MTDASQLTREKVRKEVESFKAKQSGDYPYILLTNVWDDPGTTIIAIEVAGTLSLLYEEILGGQGAAQFYVWHDDGSTTPIELGPNTVSVGVGDIVVYQLADPSTDMIKFGFNLS